MTMDDDVVITGIGLVTPLGHSTDTVLARILAGESAARPVELGGAFAKACPVWAKITDFDPEPLVPEPKTVRLMSRDALLATAAARMAIRDAGLRIDTKVPPVSSPAEAGNVESAGAPRPYYRPQDVGLFGATGLAGVPLGEVARLVESAADESGRLDLRKLGEMGLKQVRPVLSFKILSNMPLCFISIFEGIQGANAIYNPWEGQGAQAIAAGINAIRDGDAECALAGGCDVKTHELGLIALRQWGVLDSWQQHGKGSIPAESAVFLVLESARRATARGTRIYARIAEVRMATVNGSRLEAYRGLMRNAKADVLVAGGDGDVPLREAEDQVLAEGPGFDRIIRPKEYAGNLYAAAAAMQVAMAAVLAKDGSRVAAHCFGHGSEQAIFVLEGPR